MKKHFIIFIFCFSFPLLKAQATNKIDYPAFDRSYSKNKLNFSFSQYSSVIPYSQNTNYNISIRSDLPKLPFFCGMEEKFRNKFNVFLKVRAGNDESYMRMITPTSK